jgi:hypothetical protein
MDVPLYLGLLVLPIITYVKAPLFYIFPASHGPFQEKGEGGSLSASEVRSPKGFPSGQNPTVLPPLSPSLLQLESVAEQKPQRQSQEVWCDQE